MDKQRLLQELNKILSELRTLQPTDNAVTVSIARAEQELQLARAQILSK